MCRRSSAGWKQLKGVKVIHIFFLPILWVLISPHPQVLEEKKIIAGEI
jgi:hypothetical protein